MPSPLRLQASFQPIETAAVYQTSPTFPPAKKQRMSLTQTYYVASTARTKLGREAGRSDHNLRLLVGHANLLDTLMVELADAEREQEAWFHQSVTKAGKPEDRHIQWIDSIQEEDDEDDSSDDESDDGSVYDEDAEEYFVPLRKIRTPPVTIDSRELDSEDEDEDEDEDMYDYDMPALERVASRHATPELMQDSSDSDSDDETMPPSPETTPLDYSEKERQAITTTTFYNGKPAIEEYSAPLIAAC